MNFYFCLVSHARSVRKGISLLNDLLLAVLNGVCLIQHNEDSKYWELKKYGRHTVKSCNIIIDRIEYPVCSLSKNHLNPIA
jgi:hypothetical protein